MILQQVLVESDNTGVRLPAVLALVLLIALYAVVVSLLDVGPQVGRLGEPGVASGQNGAHSTPHLFPQTAHWNGRSPV